MATVHIAHQHFPLTDGESVLDGLLRQGQSIAHSCRSGVCQSCLVKAVTGTPPAAATKGLKPTLQAEGYALACQWIPAADVEISLADSDAEAAPVVIRALDRLNPDVLRVRLGFDAGQKGFDSRPGQYLNLINPEGVARSYSIANDSSVDGDLELHIANTASGEFTHWLFNRATPGTQLHARGPAGDCFYLPDIGQEFPMLLAGTGTGLAPLYGIVHDALRRGHKGPITLLHGGSSPVRLYYVQELCDLAQQYPNFTYQPYVLAAAGADPLLRQGDLNEAALEALDPARLPEQRVYLCGAPEFVQALRKRIFLKGVRSAHIHCDAFITRNVTAP